MFSLLDIWHNARRAILAKRSPSSDKKTLDEFFSPKANINSEYIQNSFALPPGVRTAFLRSSHPLVRADTYAELPSLPLTEAEQAELARYKARLHQNFQQFEDTEQFLIKDVIYIPERNLLAIEAVQAPFSLVHALEKKAFPEGSPVYDVKLYKTGVLTPLMTQDDHICLMERQLREKVFTAPTGFLVPEDGQITFPTKGALDLVVRRAVAEAKAQVLVNRGCEKPVVESEVPVLSSISIRENVVKKGIPTVEFVTPMRLRCDADQLQTIIRTTSAPDSHTYTRRAPILPLNPQNREKNQANKMEVCFEMKLPGTFFIDPILLAGTRQFGAGYTDYRKHHNSHLPHSDTVEYPVAAFEAKPSVPPITWSLEEKMKVTALEGMMRNLSLAANTPLPEDDSEKDRFKMK